MEVVLEVVVLGRCCESQSIDDVPVEALFLGRCCGSENCFSGCESLRSVVFGESSKLERLCAAAFSRTSIEYS